MNKTKFYHSFYVIRNVNKKFQIVNSYIDIDS